MLTKLFHLHHTFVYNYKVVYGKSPSVLENKYNLLKRIIAQLFLYLRYTYSNKASACTLFKLTKRKECLYSYKHESQSSRAVRRTVV